MNVIEGTFGTLNGNTIKSYTVQNENGMEWTCIEYGCTITSIKQTNRAGIAEELVLGFDTIDEYIKHSAYFGCVVGRVGGRIEDGCFTLDGKTYHLNKNNNGNTLHGGPNGFHQQLWKSRIEQGDEQLSIIFTYTSPDGEEGFPGTLETTVKYTMTNKNELIVSYHAIADQKTTVNLTNHTYFNLSGNLKKNVLDHELTLKSDSYLELDSNFIPTGKVIHVEGTVFDFRRGNQLQKGITSDDRQIKLVGGGYDHPFILNAHHQKEIVLNERESGRKLVMETDEPCVVLYTGNSLTSDIAIRGRRSEKYLGVCLETQKAPNLLNSRVIVEANEAYISKTKYTFIH